MPPLSQMTRPGSETLKGFTAVETPQRPAPVMSEPLRTTGGNAFIRCPLPPFNATIDTLRQFNENGKTPTRRVIPLPISTSVGGGGSTTNTTVINNGSSGGGSTQTKLVSASLTLEVPSLIPGQTFTATVLMAKSFQLLQITSTQALEIRLYADAATQSGDLVRITDSPVPFEVVAGIITDVVFDSSPFTWNWQNRIGANADSPQSPNIYVTVINPSSVAGTPSAQVGIQYLPLES